MSIALTILLYPGLAFTLALALAFAWLAEGRLATGWARGAAPWRTIDGAAAAASLLLSGLTLALLPWPLHPAAGWPWVGSPIALWAALEGAFLLPALVGLLAPSTLAARAAVREAQMSLAGRFVCWLALGAGLWGVAGWTLLELPGRLLLGLAALAALPAAIGVGPFGAERGLSAAGAEEGLDEATTGLVRFARSARGGALLAALAVASLPPTGGSIRPALALAVALALFALTALLLRRAGALLPRLTLPAALRWCWWRALPIAVVGLVYLAIV